jgi:ferritin-like metal-binding protein YciE
MSNQPANMKTFKDSFLNESADVHDTPRRIIKASLKLAATNEGLPARLAPGGSNEDDQLESNQKKLGAGADKSAGNLWSDIRPAGPVQNHAGPMRF